MVAMAHLRDGVGGQRHQQCVDHQRPGRGVHALDVGLAGEAVGGRSQPGERYVFSRKLMEVRKFVTS